jgi:hypothetical protein
MNNKTNYAQFRPRPSPPSQQENKQMIQVNNSEKDDHTRGIVISLFHARPMQDAKPT